MTKNVEYVLSVSEIIKLIKYKWKFIGIIALVFILLCGGYKAISGTEGDAEPQIDPNYDRDKAYYDYFVETQSDMNAAIKLDWENMNKERINSPVFSVDPYQCEYEQIVVRFSDGIGGHDKTVQNWVFKADNSKLFGEKEKEFSNYKTDLILVGLSQLSSETEVQLIAVKDFDTKKAADYLVKHFNACADEEKIELAGISTATAKGYNKNLDSFLLNFRNSYNSAYTSFVNSKALNTYITEPSQLQADQNKSNDLIKYALVGLILGLFVGIVIVAFNAIRKREIISTNQIEGAFGIELLSDCSQDCEAALDVLNANLDVMTGENNKIAIILDKSIKDIEDIVSKWTKKSDRTFISCTDIFENPTMIEDLNTVDGVVIGVRIGKSKLEQIQRVLLRADKLKKEVLGYVIV